MDPVELAHGMQNKPVTDILHRSKEQKYAFDKIFTNESQEQVYLKKEDLKSNPIIFRFIMRLVRA